MNAVDLFKDENTGKQFNPAEFQNIPKQTFVDKTVDFLTDTGTPSSRAQLSALLGGYASALAPKGTPAQRLGQSTVDVAKEGATSRVTQGITQNIKSGSSDIYDGIAQSDLALADPTAVRSTAELLFGQKNAEATQAGNTADRQSREKIAAEAQTGENTRLGMSLGAQASSTDADNKARITIANIQAQTEKSLQNLRGEQAMNQLGAKTPLTEETTRQNASANFRTLVTSTMTAVDKNINSAFSMQGGGWSLPPLKAGDKWQSITNIADLHQALADRGTNLAQYELDIANENVYRAMNLDAYREWFDKTNGVGTPPAPLPREMFGLQEVGATTPAPTSQSAAEIEAKKYAH